MATQNTEIQLIISAQNKANAELQKLSADLAKIQNNTSGASSSLGKMGLVVGGVTAAYAILKKGLFDSVKAWEEQEKVIAQTEAVIKSTGGAAGMTVEAIGSLASELQRTTTYADEVIQSGENLLLTFTNIGKDIFPQATKTMLDMSTALGQDLKGSAIQLGKALQDPILGVTALRRVGVNFNATQQETIKKLVETGKGLEAQKMILKELAKEFGGSATRQLDTFGGRMTWLKNQVGELQESFGAGITKGLVDAFMQGATGMDDFQGRAAALQVYLKAFGAALVGGFTWVFRTLYNTVTIVARAIALPFQAAYANAKDIVQTFKNLMEGDLSISTENTQRVMEDFASGVSTDVGDMQNAFENSFVSVSQSLNETAKDFKVAEKPIADFGASTEEMAKKVKEAAKKIANLKKEMKDAIKSATQDIKDLKKEFSKDELKNQQEFNKSIAETLVGKQGELKDLKTKFNEAQTNEEKNALGEQILTIQDFLKAHLSEEQKYASEITAVRQFQAMDQIQQMQFTFAQEKKAREEDYNEQLKSLKKHLKEVEKEYKEKLKDLKKDLKDELGGLTISVDIDKKKKKALGGSVMSNEAYIVGEHRPEVFVPSQSGNIRQVDQVGGGKGLTIGAINVYNEADEDRLVDKVRRMLAQDSSLGRMGIR